MVELIFLQYAQRIENVFHVATGGAPDAADLLAIKNVFQLWDRNSPLVATNLCQIRSLNCSLIQISVTSLDSVGAPVLDYVLPVASAGVLNANYAITDTLAVKWLTGLSGRNYRGRTYHCGMGYGPASDGLLAAAQAAQFQTCYTRLLTDLTTAGYSLVVASKYSGVEIVNGYRRGIPRAEGIITPIVSCGVERGIDTQRHRKIPHIV